MAPEPSVPEPKPEPPRLTRVPYYAQSTNPRPVGEPAPTFDFDLSFLDQPVDDLSASMYATAVTTNNIGLWRYGSERVVVESFTDEVTFDCSDNAILPDVPQGREVMGGWFDPNDVPPAIRDHL